jgi:hypothetical protein
MTDVQRWLIDSKVLKVLAATHPEIVEEAQRSVVPLMNDMIMIKEIYDFTCMSYQPKTDYQHKLLFIASILRLFNPDALIAECKLRHGLRASLAKCIGHSGQSTTYYINQARAYMKIRAFKTSVAEITETYLNQIPCA